MAAVGIVPGFVIGLREGIEVALVISLIVGYLDKTGRGALNRHVLVGVVMAVFASLAVAGTLFAMSVSLEGFAEQLFEGVTAIVAVAILTFMILWMMKSSVEVSERFKNRIDRMAGKGEIYGLMVFAFVAVFREGLETALFMLGAASATTTADAVAGVTIGLMFAFLIGIALPRLSVHISLRRFFQVTSIILILFAAGLFARGVHEFQEAFAIQAGSTPVYDLRGVFSSGEGNPLGYLLRGIFGYSDSPSQLEVVAYFGFLVLCAFLYWFIVLRKTSGAAVKEEAPPGSVDALPANGTTTENTERGEKTPTPTIPDTVSQAS